MTKKKPDRFERLVLKEMKKQDVPGYPCIWLNGPDVAKLLRKEHLAIVRMVEKKRENAQDFLKTYNVNTDAHKEGIAQWDECQDILDHLKKRAT